LSAGLSGVGESARARKVERYLGTCQARRLQFSVQFWHSRPESLVRGVVAACQLNRHSALDDPYLDIDRTEVCWVQGDEQLMGAVAACP
jgi:hypothetical protein